MLNKKTISFYLLGFILALSITEADAQRGKGRNKKKEISEISASERIRQAEYFFTEGEKYFILGDYT